MTSRTKALTATTLAGMLILIATIAQARTLPPLGRAHPASTANEECLRYDTTLAGGTNKLGLRNNCAGAMVWQMALPVDAAQAFTVLVSMRDSGAGAVTCTTRVRDAFGNLVLFGGDDSATSTAADGEEQLTIVSDGVPFGGSLLLQCTLSGGVNTVKLFTVDYF